MSHVPILQKKNNIILFDFIQRQYVKFYAKLQVMTQQIEGY